MKIERRSCGSTGSDNDMSNPSVYPFSDGGIVDIVTICCPGVWMRASGPVPDKGGILKLGCTILFQPLIKPFLHISEGMHNFRVCISYNLAGAHGLQVETSFGSVI